MDLSSKQAFGYDPRSAVVAVDPSVGVALPEGPGHLDGSALRPVSILFPQVDNSASDVMAKKNWFARVMATFYECGL